MSKTLTITLDNIDDLLWERGWEMSRNTIEAGFRISIHEPDHIQIDAEAFRKRHPRMFSEILSAMLTVYGINESDKEKSQNNETTDV
jgi:hypothetical protein